MRLAGTHARVSEQPSDHTTLDVHTSNSSRVQASKVYTKSGDTQTKMSADWACIAVSLSWIVFYSFLCLLGIALEESRRARVPDMRQLGLSRPESMGEREALRRWSVQVQCCLWWPHMHGQVSEG